MTVSRRFALLVLAAVAIAFAAGCTAGQATFGPVEYDQGALTVTVEAGEPVVHADLQVTVSALEGVAQREVFTEARFVDLAPGANRFTYAVELPDGAYRCYLHLYDGQERLGAVIRELTIQRGTGRA